MINFEPYEHHFFEIGVKDQTADENTIINVKKLSDLQMFNRKDESPKFLSYKGRNDVTSIVSELCHMSCSHRKIKLQELHLHEIRQNSDLEQVFMDIKQL